MYQHLVAGRGERPAARVVAGRMILRGRDEVGDHDHVAVAAAEGAIGFVPQERRHRRHAIRLLDRELRERVVGRVLSHERDVGAVQRGHDLQVALGLQHLLREPRRGGVRDGVMHVHEVELLAHGHFMLLHRQRQRVRGRLLEQRILGLRDLVERDPLDVPTQPEWARVGDEVHLVAPARELEAELGRDRPRAAVGRVAGDADSHEITRDGRRGTGDEGRVRATQRSWIRAASSSACSVASRVHTPPSPVPRPASRS